ncbi:hypothetical protein JCM19294_1204 [Nonlabens tegetincola]|uniref:Uncharacterized protein n=1 Tax=Nonlabens tegetincola TaxID=323273 RepID=A0A090Q1I4_9FLAO|nr:hypothetical protein JCM19294_1204 [Nonlabens tegetincola]
MFPNFNRSLKNMTIGLPIRDNTAAIPIYARTAVIDHRNQARTNNPSKKANALKIPKDIVFDDTDELIN